MRDTPKFGARELFCKRDSEPSAIDSMSSIGAQSDDQDKSEALFHDAAQTGPAADELSDVFSQGNPFGGSSNAGK